MTFRILFCLVEGLKEVHNVSVIWRLAAILLFTASCLGQSQQCKVTFSVVAKDDLNNMRQGFAPKTLEWFQKKMVKKYPDVCYSAGASPIVLFFSGRPAIYHGVQTLSSTSTNDNPVTGTVTDTYGQPVGQISGTVTTSTTTTNVVPYDVNYEVLYLSVETKLADGTWQVAHNFSGKTLHPTMYGICTHNCHPNHANIEQALKWLHEGGLTDPRQSVLP